MHFNQIRITFSDFSNYKKSSQVPIDNGINCFFVFSSVSRNYITIFTVIFLHNALPSNEFSTSIFLHLFCLFPALNFEMANACFYFSVFLPSILK